MAMAHSISVGTNRKYDPSDVLEMEPMRRRMLAASISVEREDAAERIKKGGGK